MPGQVLVLVQVLMLVLVLVLVLAQLLVLAGSPPLDPPLQWERLAPSLHLVRLLTLGLLCRSQSRGTCPC